MIDKVEITEDIEKLDDNEVYYFPKSQGKSYYSCICPYCNNKVNIQAWSASKGKKCSCGAVLRYTFGLGWIAEKKKEEL